MITTSRTSITTKAAHCRINTRVTPLAINGTELQKRGIDAGDIKFLQWILESDPTKRPTAAAILALSLVR